jgi:hypothetical protein
VGLKKLQVQCLFNLEIMCKWPPPRLVLYIKVTMFVHLSVCVGSAWKILPITARSLWSVLGGGGRESPVKHGAGGASTSGGGGGDGRGGASTGGEGPGEGELDGCIMHRVHTSPF